MNMQNKLLVISFSVFLILYLVLVKFNTNKPTVKNTEVLNADTYIPKGFVLVPITIDPSSQISGLINQFAIVDLYAPDTLNQTNVLVAKSVKIIRAPLNASQFAVLVSEAQSIEIMKIKTPFWITLQNRNHIKADLEKNNYLQIEKKVSTYSKDMPKSIRKKPIIQKPQIEIEYYDGT